MTDAERYRAAANRAFVLADAETDGLVKEALEHAGTSFIRAMLKLQQTSMDLPVKGSLI